jgi:type IV pilus assembly protein PilA
MNAPRDQILLSGSDLVRQGMMMRTDSQGFSLVELLIVVAIILIIAAIAIPNFMRSRVAANQASAVGSLRTLNTAEFTYASTYGKGYSATLGYLGPPPSGASSDITHAGIVDSVLSGTGSGGSAAMTSTKSGYLFTYSPGTVINGQILSYTINADPINRGTTGTNSYFVDQSGVIRQNTTTQAGAADSPLAG